jgi:DNA-binding response OmpR family regulator
MGKKTRRLLCVEDHRETCELITRVLKDFEVTSVTTKAAALESARTNRFDLIVVDYYLPDGTGEELCKHVRVFDQRTPILFITGSDDFSETRSRTIGGQGMIKKGRENFVSELKARAAELSYTNRR